MRLILYALGAALLILAPVAEVSILWAALPLVLAALLEVGE
jgi:hypothetical protein